MYQRLLRDTLPKLFDLNFRNIRDKIIFSDFATQFASRVQEQSQRLVTLLDVTKHCHIRGIPVRNLPLGPEVMIQ